MRNDFWAINQAEVKELLEFRSGCKATTTQVHRTIRILKGALAKILQNVIKEQAKEIILEETGIQLKTHLPSTQGSRRNKKEAPNG